jgi:hypothetical protein
MRRNLYQAFSKRFNQPINYFYMQTTLANSQKTETAYLASSDEEYNKLGLKKNTVEMWEDGARTDGNENSYEWWYFDAKLSDGSTMVVGFYTKLLTDIDKPLKPLIMINIDYADGTVVKKQMEFKADEYSSSTAECDVKIGSNYFKGNLESYTIHFEDDELQLDIQIKRETESWRPETGYLMFGDEGYYFAWVVAVPQGEATVQYTYQGKQTSTNGSCYHDHNWGNKALNELINHWYWQRTELGPYTVIAAEIVAEEKYGYDSIVVYNLSKNGKLYKDDGAKVKLLRSFGIPDETTGKPVSKEIMFIYEDDEEKHELKLIIEKILLDIYLIENKTAQKLAKLFTGFDGAYLRFSGSADLKIYSNKTEIESYSDSNSVWELMYFG